MSDLELRVTTGKGRTHGLVYLGESLKAVVSGRRQVRRAEELLRYVHTKDVDASRLDDRFFAAFSVYLCEEKDFNTQLLLRELGRFL